jgi:prepilin-type N-terminal cleavage/methylation domain-containing protein
MSSRRSGTTLVELLIVIAIMGIGLSVVAMAPGWIATTGTGFEGEPLVQARLQSVGSREMVTVVVLGPGDSVASLLSFLPDGRALGEDVDPLTGRRR